MSKSNGSIGKNKRKQYQSKEVKTRPKKPRVINGRPWRGFDAQVSKPIPEGVSEKVQQERCRIVKVLAYSSIALLCLLGVYAFVTKDTPMMGRILTTVQILLVSSIGSAAGTSILQSIIGWFRHHG
jgi:hypothetical protein